MLSTLESTFDISVCRSGDVVSLGRGGVVLAALGVGLEVGCSVGWDERNAFMKKDSVFAELTFSPCVVMDEYIYIYIYTYIQI